MDKLQDPTDYLLEVLAHPEMAQTDEFRRWLEDPAHRALYLDALAAADALALQERSLPDARSEWQRWQREHVLSTPPEA